MSFLHYAVDVSLPQPLQVTSDPDNVLGQHVGNGVWTSAQELAIFLCSKNNLVRDRVILELGAGLGLVGQAKLLACRSGPLLCSDTAVLNVLGCRR